MQLYVEAEEHFIKELTASFRVMFSTLFTHL